MSCSCPTHLSRRRFVFLTGAVALSVPLGGCDDSGDWPVDLVSDDQVREMGLASWKQMRQEIPLSQNAAFDGTLQDIGGRLLQALGSDPSQWEMRVFQGDQINAFALPGNKIGVFEGMMRFAETEAQLAAVIGHEIGHHLADHAQERLNAQVLKDFGINAVELVLNLGDIQYAREIAAVLGLGVEVGLQLPYTRDHELEADRLGLDLMRRADYDPHAAVALWRRMESQGGQGFAFLSTHPAPGDRAEKLERLIREV
ncbi:M48 family metallopeptidase [Caenispirillum bisanense]|uniref:Peptidase family M48 n=1 Tax=Caenispirillum bisanense TaxID=414052 RepID=A0A286G5T4_9PROT|nr:M48 family metallopeptidase [Caenispirillum bisanense]SOD90917.1 Peptidase family M48 [Caenispirillum bisanense]